MNLPRVALILTLQMNLKLNVFTVWKNDLACLFCPTVRDKFKKASRWVSHTCFMWIKALKEMTEIWNHIFKYHRWFIVLAEVEMFLYQETKSNKEWWEQTRWIKHVYSDFRKYSDPFTFLCFQFWLQSTLTNPWWQSENMCKLIRNVKL